MTIAVLSIGTNLGDRELAVTNAISELDKLENTEILKISRLYETEPVDYLDQPWFLNAAVSVKTSLKPHILLSLMLKIESDFGRVRNVPKGPRTLDLDLIFYGDMIHDDEELILPHPRMEQRRFVLVPLNDIVPDYIHPKMLKNIKTLLKDCTDTSDIRLFETKK